MPLETTATYIDSLNIAWPLGTDPLSAADQHIQLIKAAIKRTFPNVDSAIATSDVQLNYLTGVNQNIQTQFDNLRDGTATARNAGTANSASAATFANISNFARSAAALVQPTVAYGIRQSDESFAFPGAQIDVAVVTISQSGLYDFRACIVADLPSSSSNNSLLFNFDGFGTSDSARWHIDGAGALGNTFGLLSQSARASLPLQVASGPALVPTQFFPGVALILFQGRLSMDSSGSRNLVLRITSFSSAPGTIKRGSYAGARRLGNAIGAV